MNNFFLALLSKTMSFAKNCIELPLTFFIICFLVLSCRGIIVKHFQIEDKIFSYVLILFCISTVATLTHIIGFLKSFIINWSNTKKKFKVLKYLTTEEKQILKEYVINDKTVIKISVDNPDGILAGLAIKGILYCPKVTSHFIGCIHFGINPDFLSYLKKKYKFIE